MSDHDEEKKQDEQRWRIKREISTGDLIAIITALACVLTVYQRLDTRVALNERDIVELRTGLTSAKTEIREDLRDIKAALVRIGEKFEQRLGPGR